MTQRQRLMALLEGQTPDCVPWFADLSHWFVVERGQRFIPTSEADRDTEMVDLHRELNAGLYLNMGAFYATDYCDSGVTETTGVDGDFFTWAISTPVGEVREIRRWSPVSHSWDITHRMVQGIEDFPIVRYAMEARRYVPRYENFDAWNDLVGEVGVPFAVGGFCGLGFLVSRFMGVEQTHYALADEPELTRGLMDIIDAKQLELVDVLADSPSPVVLWTDNLDAATQPPPVFRRHGMDFYHEMARKVHARGKHLAIHIDGRLGGLLGLLAECGVDIADAVTPTPMGDLTPEECRIEAGPDMILWGGVPPNVWEPRWPEEGFIESVKHWLDLRQANPRIVLAPGDQVPPGAPRRRIEIAGELAQTYGRY